MNKNSLRQIIVAEMILADVEGRDRVSPKKRSLFEMMGDNYLAELEDGRLAHSMESVEDLFEAPPTKTKKPTKKKDKPGVSVIAPANDTDVAASLPVETEAEKQARIEKSLEYFDLTPEAIIGHQAEVAALTGVAATDSNTDTGGSASPAANLTPEEEEELKSEVGEGSIDLALTIAGFIGGEFGVLFAVPTSGISLVVGAIPDVINGIRKFNRGEYVDGALDFICAIPVIGEGAAIIKGIHGAEKIVKLIALGKKLKSFGKGVKAVSFITKMISKFVSSDRQAGAEAAFDDILSGDKERIKKAISATEPADEPVPEPADEPVPEPVPEPADEPVPEPVSMSGGLEYLDSLAQAELAGGDNVAESKRASRLSLVGMLYGD